jgi:hypothetical protein
MQCELHSTLANHGCFNGERENALRIEIGTDDYRNVLALAHELRDFMEQTGVGLHCNGV